MAFFNYEVGGNEIKVDANESVSDIQSNKTLLVSQLTAREPVQPEAVAGLHTVDQVFRHFKPSLEITLTDAQGVSSDEIFRFENLGDMSPRGIVRRSTLLNQLSIRQEQYMKIIKQLKSNKVLQAVLNDPESRPALLALLKHMAAELEARS